MSGGVSFSLGKELTSTSTPQSRNDFGPMPGEDQSHCVHYKVIAGIPMKHMKNLKTVAAGAAIAQVSPEAVFKADPDLLLFAGNEKDMKELIGRPGWSEMRAVRTGRVHAVNRAELLIPGPRTIDGIERLANIFHPPVATQ